MKITFSDPVKAQWEGAVIAAVGLLFLLNLPEWHGAVALLALPGSVCLLASGVGLLLWNGDARLPQFAALAAVVTVLSLPFLALSGEALTALFCAFACAAAYVCAGRVSLYHYPQIEGAPAKPKHLKAAALIAIDESLMAWFKLLFKTPHGQDAQRMADELAACEDYLGRNHLRKDVRKLHPKPPDLLKVESQDKSWRGLSYRHIHFASEYDPAPDMPGRDRWLGFEANRTAHARIFEHPGAARPWLLCIHGFRMGTAITDFGVFNPQYFHKKLGLNLACAVLPLHGPRKKGLMSGDGFLDGDAMDFIHAELQAQWDLRRLLSYLRLVKHAPAVGVYGISLGGYNTALLSGLDDGLACAVAGIPVFDIASTQWRHFPPQQLAMGQRYGLDEQRNRKVMAAVSPASFEPQLPADKLGIFAGSIDTLVWPDHPLQLQQHWHGARINWYEGCHLSFSGEAAVTETLRTTLQAGGLLDHGQV